MDQAKNILSLRPHSASLPHKIMASTSNMDSGSVSEEPRRKMCPITKKTKISERDQEVTKIIQSADKT